MTFYIKSVIMCIVLKLFYSRPEQHGADMLGPLSDLFNACDDEKSAPAAALALEGLYYLCEAEVILVKFHSIKPSQRKSQQKSSAFLIC